VTVTNHSGWKDKALKVLRGAEMGNKFKMKTHKATAKRFRVTKNGKVLRSQGGKSHLRRKKSTRLATGYFNKKSKLAVPVLPTSPRAISALNNENCGSSYITFDNNSEGGATNATGL
jgi:ribosomal protein L35